MSPPNNPIYLWKPHNPPGSSRLLRAPLGSSGGPPGSSELPWAPLAVLRAIHSGGPPGGRIMSFLGSSGPRRFGSVRFGPVRFGPVRSGSARFGPVRSGPVRSGSVRSGSARLGGGGGWVRGGRLSGRRSILVHPGFDRAEIPARAGGRDSSAAALCGCPGISEFR